VHIGATWRMRLNRPCAAAMRSFCQITLTTCLYFDETKFLRCLQKDLTGLRIGA